MAIQIVTDARGQVVAYVSYQPVYRYGGFTFELHSYFGPTKLKNDGEPAKLMGRRFWNAYSAWDKLSPEEKEATRL